jgi:hypothetical protein
VIHVLELQASAYLLQCKNQVTMRNFTEVTTEMPVALAAVQDLHVQGNRGPASPFLRISNPKLKVVAKEAFNEEVDSMPQVTLTQPSG